MEAGKDVYCEKPMTHTIDEARRVAETVKKTKQVFTVGVQSTADPRWKMANQMITEGKIGHVMQGQTSYYRNSNEGQWRYYPLTKDMNPKTVDWKMFLGTDFGLAPDQPFNRARYAQWRCYWDFGGGMYTDLFVHQLTHLITAMGVRFPRRVVGAGGLYLEYDGRDVPDVATVVADYDEGCQVIISATMCNDVQLPEVIRGHTATIKFDPNPRDGFAVVQQKLEGRPAPPGTNQGEGGDRFRPDQPREDTRALWEHFLECLRSRNPETLCPADLGYAAITTVNLGVAVLPRGQGPLLQQGERPGRARRRRLGGPLGRAEPPPRQAQPGHRLEGRRHRLAPPAPGLPEARGRLDQRQGPGGKRLSESLPVDSRTRPALALRLARSGLLCHCEAPVTRKSHRPVREFAEPTTWILRARARTASSLIHGRVGTA